MEVSPAPQTTDVDLTDDLGQRLEDIISTYQSPPSEPPTQGLPAEGNVTAPPPSQTPSEPPADQDDSEELAPISRKGQKPEKKMLKNLGKTVILSDGTRLEDIISTYQSPPSEPPTQGLPAEGNVTAPPPSQTPSEPPADQDDSEELAPISRKGQKPEKKMLKNLGKTAMQLMQSLNKLETPEKKLEAVIKKHAELVRTKHHSCRKTAP
uniref:Uncharacterized protein n=1 Tax=Periophthalmus magnuspinnatus TaxID=409849 RepID=A0A3B4BDE3_9GOBI